MDEHGIDVHCLVPLPWLECEPGVHADETKALEVSHRLGCACLQACCCSLTSRTLGAIYPTTVVVQRYGSIGQFAYIWIGAVLAFQVRPHTLPFGLAGIALSWLTNVTHITSYSITSHHITPP